MLTADFQQEFLKFRSNICAAVGKVLCIFVLTERIGVLKNLTKFEPKLDVPKILLYLIKKWQKARNSFAFFLHITVSGVCTAL